MNQSDPNAATSDDETAPDPQAERDLNDVEYQRELLNAMENLTLEDLEAWAKSFMERLPKDDASTDRA